MTSRRGMLSAVVASAMLLGCRSHEHGGTTPPVEITAAITTAKVDRGAVERCLETYGKVEFSADHQRSVPFVRSGQVMVVSVVEGQVVKKSDELLRIGAVPSGSPDVRQAIIAAEFAGRELVRVKRLVDERLATNQALQAAEQQVAAANATLRALGGGGNADGTTGSPIRASMDGIVADVLVHRGDVVQPGQTAVMLAARDSMSVRVGFEVEDLPLLSEGLAVRIESAYRNERDRAAPATLSRLHRMVDAKTQLVEGVIQVSEPPAWMAPGLSVRAIVVLEAQANAVRVPRAAIVQQGGATGVFVVEKGRASWRVVKVGLADAERMEVLSGLAAGDTVATTGRTSLSDGMVVRVVPLDKP